MSRKSKYILSPGEVVKELRLNKGWTQSILSEITGMAVSNISNIESGRSHLGEERAILLAAAFGVRPPIILFPNGFERADLKSKLSSIRARVKKHESTYKKTR